MTNAHHPTRSAAPAPTQSPANPHDTAASASKCSPAPDQVPKAGTEEDALICWEIERVLVKAMAMARYFGQDAVENAIALASRINRMEFDGRKA
ncbi:MAG: hypothetical protein HEQ16_06555 [Bosea sp.]|jgi:hypothetical protein|nr:hypothetical protein [Bosea sp. (in: a-proteobacteria)]